MLGRLLDGFAQLVLWTEQGIGHIASQTLDQAREGLGMSDRIVKQSVGR